MTGDDRRWMNMALSIATLSPIEKTKVGVVIVGDTRLLSFGYNTEDMHAEINAIGRLNHMLSQKCVTLYCTWFPCEPCAQAIIDKVDIMRVVALPQKANYDKYSDSQKRAYWAMYKAGLTINILEDTFHREMRFNHENILV